LSTLTWKNAWQWMPACIAIGSLMFCASYFAQQNPATVRAEAIDSKKTAAVHACNGCCAEGCPVLAPDATPEEIELYMQRMMQVSSRFNDSRGSRWSNTLQTSGTIFGDPVVITWSFVPDGTIIPANSYNGSVPSRLMSGLDAQMTRSTWQNLVRRAFADWSKLSGIRYVEVPDDGAAWGSAAAAGTRGDVRIFGCVIDGGVVGYTYYPGSGTGGDMVLDTSYNWNTPSNDYCLFRNLIMHEHGHGFGLGHVTSANGGLLMEPVLSTSYVGPQDDDIRGGQRLYGDTYERPGSSGTGHNNSLATATNLGTLTSALSAPNASINDAADVDYYKFTLSTSANVTVSVAPLGGTYSLGNQGSPEVAIDTRRIHDLQFDILNGAGSTIAAVNATGAGSAETHTRSLGAGTYFVRVDNVTSVADIQLYTLNLSATSTTTPPPPPPPTPTLTSISVSPISATVLVGGSQQFSAVARDQNGIAMSPQPAFSWSTTGGGSINAGGLFVASATGTFSVSASASGKSGAANITINAPTTTPPPPTGGQQPYKGVPFAIPGTIQGEDFDEGGEGVAYHDIDVRNYGGQYRTTAVDVETCSEGGCDIVYTNAGEWLEYTVNVASAGTYTLEARAYSNYYNTQFHVEFNGVNKSGTINVPRTSGLNTWQTIRVDNVVLSAGQQVMRVYFDSAYTNLNNVRFSLAGSTPTPPPPTGGILPGKIEAENYRAGGEGVGYHETTATNYGGKLGRTDGVDIDATTDSGGGYYVGWTAAGEWLAYDINAASAGTYTFTLRVGTAMNSQTLHLELDGQNVSGTRAVPNTGSWYTFGYLSVTGINIPAGTHVLKVVFDTGSTNFNYINVNPTTSPGVAPAVMLSASPNPAAPGEAVGFASNVDPDAADPIAVTWDFGDGTQLTAPQASHTFTALGNYGVTVTIENGLGHAFTESLNVAVNSPAVPETLARLRLSATLNLSETNLDRLTLSANLKLPAETELEGSTIRADIGGVLVSGMVDSRGRAMGPNGSIRISRSGKVSIAVRAADLMSAWSDEGMVNATVKDLPLNIVVTITVGDQIFSGTFAGRYSAKSNAIGHVRK
jgi:hypothetical protein